MARPMPKPEWRCPECRSINITIYQDATAVFEQYYSGIDLTDTLTFDHIEGLECRTCNYSEGGPGSSDGPSHDHWTYDEKA